MKMTGNTILITGGTSGIGKALAAQLLARGNTVLITGRTKTRLEAAKAELPGVHCFVCDQSDTGGITRLHDRVVSAFPELNILINNAGIGLKRNLNDVTVSPEDLEREIRTNLIGPIQLNHLFLPVLKRQKAAAIVNVTSGLAFVPLGPKPLYSATKFAMHSYSMTLRAQLSHSSVKVFELAPPATATEFNKGQEDMNSGNRMSPEKVAEVAIDGMARDQDEILPGAARILRLMGRLRAKLVLGQTAAEKMSKAG